MNIKGELQKWRISRFWGRAAIIVAAGTLLSRVSGLGRMRYLAGQLGAGEELDVFYAAFRVPDLLASLLVTGTLSVAVVPVFAKYLNINSGAAWKLAKLALLGTAGMMFVAACLISIFADPLANLIAPGFSLQQREMLAVLMRLIAVGQIFLSVSVLASALLQTLEKFLLPALAPTFYNLGIIFGAVVLYPHYGMAGLGYGVILGAGLHLFVQAPQVWAYFLSVQTSVTVALGKEWRIRDQLKDLLRLYLPRLIYLDLGQASLMAATVVASGMASGTVSVYVMSYDLALAPMGVFAASIMTAVYPELSRLYAKGEIVQYYRILFASSGRVLALMLVSGAVLWVFGRPAVELLLQTGAFGSSDVAEASDTLSALSLGLPALGLLPLLTRSFWARGSSRLPLLATWAAIICYCILAFVASHFMNGSSSASLAWILSLSAWLAAGILLWQVTSRFRKLDTDAYRNSSHQMRWGVFLTFVRIAPAVIISSLILRWGEWPTAFSVEWWGRVFAAGFSAIIIYGLTVRTFIWRKN